MILSQVLTVCLLVNGVIKDYCTSSINITDGNQPFTIFLQSGYLDRFNVNQGWMASGNSPSGLWERANPT